MYSKILKSEQKFPIGFNFLLSHKAYDGGEGKWIFNEGNELETLIIVLVSPTAPQAKIFSYNETVLQWKTSFLSKKSLKISLTDT